MSDQYIPMIERISEEYDESDSNMVLEPGRYRSGIRRPQAADERIEAPISFHREAAGG